MTNQPNKVPEPTITAVTIRAPSRTARASCDRGSSLTFGKTPHTLPALQMNPKIIPLGEGKAVNVIGNAITIRLHGRDTGGVLSVFESVDQPGGGPPPHIHHREDETFQVLEGEYEFTCGGKTFKALPGATIFAPRGIAHSYRYVGSTPGRLVVTLGLP